MSEIKDIICKRLGQSDNSELDIASLCKKLLDDGPCFFILDNCERYTYLDASEQSKLDRFIMFCLEHEDVYLIVSGDKETFFEWYTPFDGMNMSTICEIKPIDGTKAIDAYGEETRFWDASGRYKPIECTLLQRKLSLEKVLEDVLKNVKDEGDFRKIVAVFVDRNEKHLVRYTLEDVFFETAIPHKKALAYITILKEKDILKEFELMGQAYYTLSGRYLKEPLYKVLRLADYEEKRKIRNMLKNSIIRET